jgi:hypothetical protein
MWTNNFINMEEIMPKVVYTQTKGLFQDSGPSTGQHPVDLNGVNRSGKARDRYYLEEYFALAPKANLDIARTDQSAAEQLAHNIANKHFELIGNTAACALSAARPGVTVTADNTDGRQAIVTPHLDANQTGWATTTWGTDNYTEWECAITLAATDNQKVWAGLKLTNDQLGFTDASQIFFKAQSDATNGEFLVSQSAADDGVGMKWSIIYSVSGVDYTTNTNLTITAGTTYNLKIVFDGDRKASAFINGTQYGLQTHSGTTATWGQTGVLLNDAAGVLAAASAGQQTITVDTVDATTKFKAGDAIYKSDGTLFGNVASVAATSIVLDTLLANIDDDDHLYSFGQIVSDATQKSNALASADLIPYIGLETGDAANEAIDIHYIAMNRKI